MTRRTQPDEKNIRIIVPEKLHHDFRLAALAHRKSVEEAGIEAIALWLAQPWPETQALAPAPPVEGELDLDAMSETDRILHEHDVLPADEVGVDERIVHTPIAGPMWERANALRIERGLTWQAFVEAALDLYDGVRLQKAAIAVVAPLFDRPAPTTIESPPPIDAHALDRDPLLVDAGVSPIAAPALVADEDAYLA